MESVNCPLSPLSSVASEKPLCPSCLPKGLSSPQACSFCFCAQSMECFRRETQGYADRISYKSMPSRPRWAQGWVVILLFISSYCCLIPTKLCLLFQTIKDCVYVCVCLYNKKSTTISSLLMTWTPSGLRALLQSPLFLLPNPDLIFLQVSGSPPRLQ